MAFQERPKVIAQLFESKEQKRGQICVPRDKGGGRTKFKRSHTGGLKKRVESGQTWFLRCTSALFTITA